MNVTVLIVVPGTAANCGTPAVLIPVITCPAGAVADCTPPREEVVGAGSWALGIVPDHVTLIVPDEVIGDPATLRPEGTERPTEVTPTLCCGLICRRPDGSMLVGTPTHNEGFG